VTMKKKDYGIQLCCRLVPKSKLIDVILNTPTKKKLIEFQTTHSNWNRIFSKKVIFLDTKTVNEKRLIKGYGAKEKAIRRNYAIQNAKKKDRGI